MDNLAHGLFGGILGAILAPDVAEKYKGRLILASAALVNLPDIDLLLNFLGEEIYFFHHRGITHSVFGLLGMIPLAMWIFGKIMGKRFKAECGPKFSRSRVFLFVLVQLLIGHFFLDYLTAFGTMFFYPFSFERFSYPLMFIIDPLFWVLSGAGVLLFSLRSSWTRQAIHKIAIGALVMIFGLWSFELVFKKEAEALYLSKVGDNNQLYDLTAYPGPLSPFFWVVLGEMNDPVKKYHQAVITRFQKDLSSTYLEFPIPSSYTHEQFCSDKEYNLKAQQAFLQYQRWGEKVSCSVYTLDGKEGCRCISLKYGIPGHSDELPFSAYWISPKGETKIPDRGNGNVFGDFLPF